MSELLAYLRVSHRTQNEARQIYDLKKKYPEIKDENIIIEKASGKNFIDRSKWQELRDIRLRNGDTLVICSLDRMGRNYDEIKSEYDFLSKKGINLDIMDMPLLSTLGKEDLTKKLIGDIVLSLLSYVAEKERHNIKERQRGGIDACLAENRPYGKPKENIPKGFIKYYGKEKRKPSEVMKLCDMGKSSFYYYKKRYDTEISKAV